MRWKAIAALTLAIGTSSQAREPEDARRDMSRLSASWNRLIAEVRGAQTSLTRDENAALDAILMQIQEGLVSVGMAPARQIEARNIRNSVRQLVPNTTALRLFFKRKQRESPTVEAFRRLSIDARTLAEATANLAPTVAAGSGHH